MPKKTQDTADDQAKRFERAVQNIIDAGELNPTEADAKFECAMARVVEQRRRWFDAEEASGSPPPELS